MTQPLCTMPGAERSSLPFNAGFDPVCMAIFYNTANSRHLGRQNGVLQDVPSDPAFMKRQVEWKVRDVYFIHGHEMTQNNRVTTTDVLNHIDGRDNLTLFTERMVMNLFGSFYQPMFAERVLLLVKITADDSLQVWQVDGDATREKSIISRPDKTSFRNDRKWAFVV